MQSNIPAITIRVIATSIEDSMEAVISDCKLGYCPIYCSVMWQIRHCCFQHLSRQNDHGQSLREEL